MNKISILPTPVHLEVLSDRKVLTSKITRTQNLDGVLQAAEQAKFRKDFALEQFRKEGYALRTTQDGINIYAESDAGFYYAKNILPKLRSVPEGGLQEVLIVDYPAFPIRGVSEGFYGMPWTWQERTDVIEAASQVGFNAFIFAPPDINRKVNWREPLPYSYKEKLEELIKHSHKHHVKFVYEVLPIGIDLASKQDYKKLLERCKEVITLGADAIMVAFDDTNDYEGQRVKKEKAALGQARLANNLLQQLGSDDVLLAFVPVEYHGTKVTPYLVTIGKELDPEVYIGWSGPKIRSASITKEDAERYAEIVRRKPFLGHNFPVVDEMRKKRRLTIGPLMGLDSRLTDAVSGISFNCMEVPYASLVSLFTAGDFAWNPNWYIPRRSIINSARVHGTNLMKLVELNPESYANPSGVPDIARALRHHRLKDLHSDTVSELRRIFNTMVSLDDLMSEGIDSIIYHEIRPWLVQGNIVGALGNLILDGKGSTISWKTKGYVASKMITGPRLGGTVFEDWILREMGFPANLFYYVPGSWAISYFLETMNRKRHQRQRSI